MYSYTYIFKVLLVFLALRRKKKEKQGKKELKNLKIDRVSYLTQYLAHKETINSEWMENYLSIEIMCLKYFP